MFPDVFDLWAVRLRPIEGEIRKPLVRDRQLQTVAEGADRRLAHLLHLVGGVPPLPRLAQEEPLDRLDQDGRRAPLSG